MITWTCPTVTRPGLDIDRLRTTRVCARWSVIQRSSYQTNYLIGDPTPPSELRPGW